MYLPLCQFVFTPLCCAGAMQMVCLASCRCTCHCVFTPLWALYRDHADGILGFMEMYLSVSTCRCVFTSLSVLYRDHADGLLGFMQMYLPLCVYTFVGAVQDHADGLIQYLASCRCTCHCVFTPLWVLYRDHADGLLGFMQMYLPLCVYTFVCAMQRPCRWYAWLHADPPADLPLYVYAFVSTCH